MRPRKLVRLCLANCKQSVLKDTWMQVSQVSMAANILQEEERRKRLLIKKEKRKNPQTNKTKKESCYKTTTIILTLPIILTQHRAITNNNIAIFFSSLLVPGRSLWIIKIMMMCLIPGKSLYWIENAVNGSWSCYISCWINFESNTVIYWHSFSGQDVL